MYKWNLARPKNAIRRRKSIPKCPQCNQPMDGISIHYYSCPSKHSKIGGYYIQGEVARKIQIYGAMGAFVGTILDSISGNRTNEGQKYFRQIGEFIGLLTAFE